MKFYHLTGLYRLAVLLFLWAILAHVEAAHKLVKVQTLIMLGAAAQTQDNPTPEPSSTVARR